MIITLSFISAPGRGNAVFYAAYSKSHLDACVMRFTRDNEVIKGNEKRELGGLEASMPFRLTFANMRFGREIHRKIHRIPVRRSQRSPFMAYFLSWEGGETPVHIPGRN